MVARIDAKGLLRKQATPNYALKRTMQDEVSGENHALWSARLLGLGVRLAQTLIADRGE
jgi:hypothetical protein